MRPAVQQRRGMGRAEVENCVRNRRARCCLLARSHNGKLCPCPVSPGARFLLRETLPRCRRRRSPVRQSFLVDRLFAIDRALITRLSPKHSGDAMLQDTPITRWDAVAVSGLMVQCPQRLHHVIEAYRVLGSGCLPQSRRRLDRAGIRGPGGEDGALLVEGQVGILDDTSWMLEGLRRAQEIVQVEIETRPLR